MNSQATNKKSPPSFLEGLRFECQGSGNCCTSRGSYGYVYLDAYDRQRLAKALGITTRNFTSRYCEKTDGYWHLKDRDQDCAFLKDRRCSVYPGRPTQCRTWPFWPENLNPRVWTTEIASFCPGVGKGPKVSAAEIKRIAATERRAEKRR